MDIEDYLEQKRTLEAKKELLEAKERLKEDAEKRKRELEKEKKKVVEKPSHGEPSASERSVRDDSQDMYRRIIMWNIIILVLIIGLFSFLYFYPREGKTETSTTKDTSSLTGSTVIETKDDQPPSTIKDHQQNITNHTQEETTYPGPEFDFLHRIKSLVSSIPTAN